MKYARVWIAAGVLCGLILLAGYSVYSVKRSCGRLSAQTERIAAAAGTEEAAAEIAALEQLWQTESRRLHLFLPNDPLADLNEAIVRLDALSQAESDELCAELSAICGDLRWISSHQCPLLIWDK